MAMDGISPLMAGTNLILVGISNLITLMDINSFSKMTIIPHRSIGLALSGKIPLAVMIPLQEFVL